VFKFSLNQTVHVFRLFARRQAYSAIRKI